MLLSLISQNDLTLGVDDKGLAGHAFILNVHFKVSGQLPSWDQQAWVLDLLDCGGSIMPRLCTKWLSVDTDQTSVPILELFVRVG